MCGAEGNRPRGEKARGATVQGAIIQGAIDQGGNWPGWELTKGGIAHGGNWPRGELSWGGIGGGELSGGYCPGGNWPRTISTCQWHCCVFMLHISIHCTIIVSCNSHVASIWKTIIVPWYNTLYGNYTPCSLMMGEVMRAIRGESFTFRNHTYCIDLDSFLQYFNFHGFELSGWNW